jgi:hypothetical protein
MTKIESYYWGDWLVLVYPECPFCLSGEYNKTKPTKSVHRCHHPKNNQVHCDISHHETANCPFVSGDYTRYIEYVKAIDKLRQSKDGE